MSTMRRRCLLVLWKIALSRGQNQKKRFTNQMGSGGTISLCFDLRHDLFHSNISRKANHHALSAERLQEIPYNVLSRLEKSGNWPMKGWSNIFKQDILLSKLLAQIFLFFLQSMFKWFCVKLGWKWWFSSKNWSLYFTVRGPHLPTGSLFHSSVGNSSIGLRPLKGAVSTTQFSDPSLKITICAEGGDHMGHLRTNQCFALYLF